MPSQMAPGRDVDRRGRVGRDELDQLSRLDAYEPTMQVDEQLTARAASTIDVQIHRLAIIHLRRLAGRNKGDKEGSLTASRW